MRDYVASLVDRNGYQDYVSYSTTVERAEKVDGEWKLTLRKEGKAQDYWWSEYFDAVIVATGHYSVPYIPAIPGLEQLQKSRPGSVVHSKHFRGNHLFKGKVSSYCFAEISPAIILTFAAHRGCRGVCLGGRHCF